MEFDSAQEKMIPRERKGRGKVGFTIYKTTFSLTALALPQAPKRDESQPAREGERGMGEEEGGWQRRRKL